MSAEYARNPLTPESRSPRCAHAPRGHHSRLSSALLFTVDLKSLVKGFAAEVRAFVPCEGIEYVNAERGFLFRDGDIYRHRYRYTLRIEGAIVGKIAFSRSWRFNKDELAVLESLLVELIIPLQRALKHLSPPESDSGVEKGAQARYHPRAQPEAPIAGIGNAQPTPAPQAPLLSLVPLGEDGDYPSELTESLPRERENNPPLTRGHSLLPSALRDSELGIPGNRGRDWHARLAELIGRSAISEQELFTRARAVLGYYAYSEDALAIMERLANSPSYTPERSANPLG